MKWKLPSRAAIEFFIEDGTIYRQRAYIIGFVIIISGLLFHAATGRQEEPLNVTEAKLNTYQSVGDGTVSLALTSKVYDPQKDMIELEFKATSANGLTTLTGNEVDFTGSVAHGNAELNVIPTINNHWTILVTKLDQKFGALQIKAKSNIPTKPSITNQKVENNKPKFAMIQTHLKTDNHLKNKSVKVVALDAVSDEIDKQELGINSLKDKIKDGNKLIDFDQNQINKLQQNSDTLTNSEAKNAADTITNLNQEIDTTNQTIEVSNNKINSKTKTIARLKKKKVAIKNGSFDFPAKQQTGVLKTIKKAKK
jgi:hypothetical protein